MRAYVAHDRVARSGSVGPASSTPAHTTTAVPSPRTATVLTDDTKRGAVRRCLFEMVNPGPTDRTVNALGFPQLSAPGGNGGPVVGDADPDRLFEREAAGVEHIRRGPRRRERRRRSDPRTERGQRKTEDPETAMRPECAHRSGTRASLRLRFIPAARVLRGAGGRKVNVATATAPNARGARSRAVTGTAAIRVLPVAVRGGGVTG